MWKLDVRKAKKATFSEHFCVARDLPPVEYAAAKTDAYLRAIRVWNELDGSVRQRIPIPPFAVKAASADTELASPENA